jgi:hypothetical protein
MDPINDDEFEDDTITQEDMTPLHSAPEPDTAAPPVEPVAQADEDDPDSPQPEAADGKRVDVVPHAKFHAANERAKNERMARENAERRLDAILQAVNNQRGQQPAPAQTEQPVDPDPMPPEDDIVALAQWNARQIVRQREERQQYEQRSRQEHESIELGTRVKTAAQQDFAAYAAEDPTLSDAYNVVAQSRARELMARGFTREQAEAQFQQEELELYYEALQARRRPSQVIIAMAQARGWQPAAGAAPQSGAPAPAAAPNEDRRALHTSLSSVSGGEAPRALTAKDLLAMDEDEFARVSDSVVNKLMKGNAA